MSKFELYMEKVNVHYQFLKKYYQSDDIASIYGVDKFEIRHSNVLKWILEPKGDEAIDYLPIRNLLKLIQSNNQHYECLSNLNIDDCLISNVEIEREKYYKASSTDSKQKRYIDLLITLEINESKYLIVVENKLLSGTHSNQLQEYKDLVNSDERLKEFTNKVFVFLHPGFFINSGDEQTVFNAKYVPITYQNIYETILKFIVEFSDNSTLHLITDYYIHTLCCYDSDELQGLIVTDKEINSLCSMFQDKEVCNMLNSIIANRDDDYTKYYKSNKSIFVQMFRKYLRIIKDTNVKEKWNLEVLKDRNLTNNLEQILTEKCFNIKDGKSYSKIADLLEVVFKELLDNYTLEDLYDVRTLFSVDNPLLVPKEEIDNVKNRNWYSSKYLFEHKGSHYYILSSWLVKEYGELKRRFNKLSDKYSIVLE